MVVSGLFDAYLLCATCFVVVFSVVGLGCLSWYLRSRLSLSDLFLGWTGPVCRVVRFVAWFGICLYGCLGLVCVEFPCCVCFCLLVLLADLLLGCLLRVVAVT